MTMHPVRRRKLGLFLWIIITLSIVIGLVLYALRQNISLFYSPTMIAQGNASVGTRIRVGGMVEKGSVVRDPNNLSVRFRVTDYQHTIEITYQGILPDLFREEQGVVALGQLSDKQHFVAQEILAKHDENYMPREVKEALAQTVARKNT